MPASAENACSKCHDVGVMFEYTWIAAVASQDLLPWLRLRVSALGRLDVSESSGGTLGGPSVLAALDGNI